MKQDELPRFLLEKGKLGYIDKEHGGVSPHEIGVAVTGHRSFWGEEEPREFYRSSFWSRSPPRTASGGSAPRTPTTSLSTSHTTLRTSR